MLYSKRSISATLVLAALVGVTSWLSIRTAKEGHQVIRSNIVSQIIHDATVVQMNAEGLPHYQTNIQKITRFRNNDSLLANVHGTLYEQDRKLPAWQLQAKQGKVIRGNHKIVLWNHVIIGRKGNAYASPITLTTNTLTLYPKRRFAETAAPVTIFQPGTANVTTAIGMHVNAKTHTATLLSHVHSVFDPHAKNRSS